MQARGDHAEIGGLTEYWVGTLDIAGDCYSACVGAAVVCSEGAVGRTVITNKGNMI